MLSENIIITDIGSTTTKAILLKRINNTYQLIDYETAQTTVEKPFEDVKIGIFRSIKKLENKTGGDFFEEHSKEDDFKLKPDINYYTTSSAGGGLQILVIGLTKSDSATSAEKAAYGVGGVLLDTIAIDDKRTTIEKMHLFDTLHPDIILFCGGVDGGALFSVYRLAEILKLSNPRVKFESELSDQNVENRLKIPLVFAGNKDAEEFITTIFKEKFDLHIVPNLRPTMLEENLAPASDAIHELFMNNVMEQAPGYSKVKKMVNHPIIPTPKGVLNALNILSLSLQQNLLAFDIGGATTDVFTNILGKFYRTVSANFGMSYSIGNVLSESNITDILKYFKAYFDNYTDYEEAVCNYVGNKILYPDQNPQNELQQFIEHILAIQAVKLSKLQHYQMHFRCEQLGFLDKLKTNFKRDKFVEKMYYPSIENRDTFKISDIRIMIAAGGVISHANPLQAVFMSIESLKPEGVTQIWRDKYFISPHLGKLAQADPELAEYLINHDCFERLVLYIRPKYHKFKAGKLCLTLLSDQNISVSVTNNSVIYLDNLTNSKLKIITEKDVFIEDEYCLNYFSNDLPIIIDARNPEDMKPEYLLKALNPYDERELKNCNPTMHVIKEQVVYKTEYQEYKQCLNLPYEGQLMVKEHDEIEPGMLIGENKFEPPKISVILLSSMVGKTLTEEEVRAGILIKEREQISVAQKIFVYEYNDQVFKSQNCFYTPVRGIVEQISYSTGTIIVREIQDYPVKPVFVEIAKQLKIEPKYIKGYLKKKQGEFIYFGEPLAVNSHSGYYSVESPYTGTIQGVDMIKGGVSICYDKEPYQLHAHAFARVTQTRANKEIDIKFKAIRINGKIGFGKENGGFACLFNKADDFSKYKHRIIFCKELIDISTMRKLADNDIKGLICPTISYHDLKEFIGKDIGVALTGNESLPFSMIILNGFSSESNKYENLSWMESLEKHYVSINPHTQIRAGVSRPEIYIYDIIDDGHKKEKWC